MSTALSPSTAVHVTDLKNDEIKEKGREFDGQLAKDQSCPLSSKHSTLISTLTKKKIRLVDQSHFIKVNLGASVELLSNSHTHSNAKMYKHTVDTLNSFRCMNGT